MRTRRATDPVGAGFGAQPEFRHRVILGDDPPARHPDDSPVPQAALAASRPDATSAASAAAPALPEAESGEAAFAAALLVARMPEPPPRLPPPGPAGWVPPSSLLSLHDRSV